MIFGSQNNLLVCVLDWWFGVNLLLTPLAKLAGERYIIYLDG